MTTSALSPDATLAETVPAVLLACARALDAAMAHLLETGGAEGAKEARVALRRLKSALRAFAAHLPGKRRKALLARAMRAFRDLSPLRDAEVEAELTGHAPAHLPALRKATVKALRKDRAHTIGARLARAVARHKLDPSGRRAGAPVLTAAARALSRSWRKARQIGAGRENLADLSEKHRHDLRKALKTLRYQAEFFAFCFPQDDAPRRRRAFQSLQDDLGALNDADTLARQGKADPALLAERQHALARASALWSELVQEPHWWQPDQAAPVTKASSG